MGVYSWTLDTAHTYIGGNVMIKGGVKDGTPYVECPLCGRPCEVRLTKKGLPFFQCPDCRLQVFIRDKAGAKRLANIVKQGRINQ